MNFANDDWDRRETPDIPFPTEGDEGGGGGKGRQDEESAPAEAAAAAAAEATAAAAAVVVAAANADRDSGSERRGEDSGDRATLFSQGGDGVVVLAGGFESINTEENFFNPANKIRGKQILAAGHLSKVQEIRQRGKVTIQASCTPEMKIRKGEYKVEFLVDFKTRKVQEGRCSCLAGVTGKCKHSAAVYLFINAERSEGKTDETQAWHGPSQRAQLLYPKGEKIQKLFNTTPVPRPQFVKTREHCQNLAAELEQFGLTDSCLFKSLTSSREEAEPEGPPRAAVKLLPEMAAVLQYEVIIVCANLRPKSASEKEIYDNFVRCREEEATEKIFVSTVGQSQNKEWFKQRKYRISASKGHRIAKARPENRLKYFVGFQGDHSNLRYGREMEPIAVKKYEEITRNSVYQSGVIVKGLQPWLCGSPDGIVKDATTGEIIVLEVKCPSSCKGKKISVPYLTEEKVLKRNHEYFAQVQLLMYCTNVCKAHFFVFSEVDFVLIEIVRDDQFL